MKLGAATLVGICLGSCLAARTSQAVTCSTFNERGDAVMVTVALQRMVLQISPASGGSFSLSTAVGESGVIGCGLFFDRDGRFVAVGLNHLGLKTGPLRIAVADLPAKKLISDFAVQPNTALGASLKLVGFLRGSPKLVVLGSGAPDHPTRAFSTMLLRLTGESDNTPESRTLPENTLSVGNVSFADARHDRLWLKSSPRFCPLRSVTLVEDGPEQAIVDETSAQAACDVVSAIAYPDDNTLVTATTREPDDLVTRVDLTPRSAEQVALPRAEGNGSYTTVERGLLSPDGQVFAVYRDVLSNSLFGDAHRRSSEIDLVQVAPLKIIGEVQLKPDTDPASLSIDHRNGVVSVLSFENGRWTSKQLRVQ